LGGEENIRKTAAGVGYAVFGHIALLPVCVLLDSPIAGSRRNLIGAGVCLALCGLIDANQIKRLLAGVDHPQTETYPDSKLHHRQNQICFACLNQEPRHPHPPNLRQIGVSAVKKDKCNKIRLRIEA